jgi:hypothetical protein
MLLDFRTFFRNHIFLNAVGITYNWRKHQQYHQSLKDKNLEPMSLYGVIQKYGEVRIGDVVEAEDKESDQRLQQNIPLIQSYLNSIGEMTRSSITLENENFVRKEFPGIFDNDRNNCGFRRWKLSHDNGKHTVRLVHVDENDYRQIEPQHSGISKYKLVA